MKNTVNKTISASIFAAALGAIPVVQAADGTINFTGAITDQACTVNTASTNLNVPLGKISNKAFGASSGTVAVAKSFSITLDSCPATVTAAQVSFGGTAHSANAGILALTSTSVATNVGVALYESGGITQIPLYTPSAVQTVSTTTSTLDFVAKYMSTAASVTPGTANATADFTIIYP